MPLSDPTCYAPVIDYVRTLAESMDDGKNYVVLLIITDGGISGEFGQRDALTVLAIMLGLDTQG